VSLAFRAEFKNLDNDIDEFRSDGADAIRFEGLLDAFKNSNRKDYDQIPVLLEAAHKSGIAGLLSSEDWIKRFPEQFNPDLFSNAKKTSNQARPE
jgi:hypothetical protein